MLSAQNRYMTWRISLAVVAILSLSALAEETCSALNPEKCSADVPQPSELAVEGSSLLQVGTTRPRSMHASEHPSGDFSVLQGSFENMDEHAQVMIERLQRLQERNSEAAEEHDRLQPEAEKSVHEVLAMYQQVQKEIKQMRSSRTDLKSDAARAALKKQMMSIRALGEEAERILKDSALEESQEESWETMLLQEGEDGEESEDTAMDGEEQEDEEEEDEEQAEEEDEEEEEEGEEDEDDIEDEEEEGDEQEEQDDEQEGEEAMEMEGDDPGEEVSEFQVPESEFQVGEGVQYEDDEGDAQTIERH